MLVRPQEGDPLAGPGQGQSRRGRYAKEKEMNPDSASIPKLVIKKWGTEEIIVNSNYCGKRLTVMPGYACSIHYHIKKTETFFVLDGRLTLELYRPHGIGNQLDLIGCKLLHAGRALTIEPMTPHRFWAYSEPVRFMEFSTPDEAEDSIRLCESGPIPGNCLPSEEGW